MKRSSSLLWPTAALVILVVPLTACPWGWGDLYGECHPKSPSELEALANRDPACDTLVISETDLVDLSGIDSFEHGTILLMRNERLADVSQIEDFSGLVYARDNPALSDVRLGPLNGQSSVSLTENALLRHVRIEAGGSEPWEVEDPWLELDLGAGQPQLSELSVSCVADVECALDIGLARPALSALPSLEHDRSTLRRLHVSAPEPESLDALLSWPVPSRIDLLEMPPGDDVRDAVSDFIEAQRERGFRGSVYYCLVGQEPGKNCGSL